MLKSRAWGVTLGAVILVIFISLTLALSLAGLATLHLNMASRLMAQAKARDLAESAMAIAIADVMENPRFGNNATGTVAVLDNGTDWSVSNAPGMQLPPPLYAGEGLLTFDSGAATTLQIPWSLNNLANRTSATGWDNRTIPGSTIHVAAMGVEGTERAAYEALIELPPFPYALASSGAITSTGNLLAASVPCPCSKCINIYSLCPNRLGPANLGSNNSGAPAIALQAARVNGDVDAVGCVSLSKCTLVEGAVQQHVAPITLPYINLPGQFLQIGEYPNVQTLTAATAPVTGVSQVKGDLTVAGDLVMSGGVLFVLGNLVVSGGIHGVGAVFVQGSVDIQGCSTLTTDDVCALMAQGPITLEGAGQGSSYFQGMVYSSTSITASSVTVLGSMVANGAALPPACSPACPVPTCAPPNGSGNMSLSNVSVITALNNVHTAGTTSYVPPAAVFFGTQEGVGAGAYQIGFRGPDVEGSIFGGTAAANGVIQRGCLTGLGLAQCSCPCQGCLTQGCTNGKSFVGHCLLGTGWQAQCPIIYCVTALPACPPTGPVTKVCISRNGKKRVFCYPLSKCSVQCFMLNCVGPAVHDEMTGTWCWGISKAKVNYIPCLELNQAPKVQLQVTDIVEFHSCCSYQTHELLNRCGSLFYIDWNQFLPLSNQLRTLYWADVDASKLGGPANGAWPP